MIYLLCNILKYASSSLGNKHSEEVKLKISLRQKDKKGENHQRFGKFHTEETKAKTSKKVFVYSNDNPLILLFEFTSFTNAAKHFNCSQQTMTNYVDKNKLYKDKWLLLTNPKEEV
jgi:hypothetical protein